MRSIRILLACSALCASCAAAQFAPPDDIYFNGRIYTGAGFAEDKPQTVEAIAIGGGKVLAVGSNDEIKRLAGPNTHLHALDTARTGTIVFPGINDAHTHLGSAGQTKLNVDLTGVKSLAEMLAVVRKFAQAAPAGHWLTGGNWDHTFWTTRHSAHPAGSRQGHRQPSGYLSLVPHRRPHRHSQHSCSQGRRNYGQNHRAAGRRDRSRQSRRTNRHSSRIRKRTHRKNHSSTNAGRTPPRRRTRHRRCALPRRHQRAGLLRLGRLSHL